jgi:hypothetical protein
MPDPIASTAAAIAIARSSEASPDPNRSELPVDPTGAVHVPMGPRSDQSSALASDRELSNWCWIERVIGWPITGAVNDKGRRNAAVLDRDSVVLDDRHSVFGDSFGELRRCGLSREAIASPGCVAFVLYGC